MCKPNYILIVMLAFGPVALCIGVASSQDCPHKPIRIITTSPGGGSDFMARRRRTRNLRPVGPAGKGYQGCRHQGQLIHVTFVP